MRTKQVAVWLTDGELVALVRARAKTEQRTLAAAVQEALRAWLAKGPPPVDPGRPPVVAAPKGPPVAAPGMACRRCGHEARKHEPACIMMGCPCRKLV
jgi:hypothetical protein